jgi:hypothetical protein
VAKTVANLDPLYRARLAHYERLAGAMPGVEVKGAANRYTSLNGHMFSHLHPSGSMALRLPTGEREAFLERHATALFQAYGVVQKEYVTVPDDLLADTDRLLPYFQASYHYVRALKPKATTKPNKKPPG